MDWLNQNWVYLLLLGVMFMVSRGRMRCAFGGMSVGLSLHRELLSDEYVTALQKLHDSVVPFPGAVAQAEIETSFGRPVKDLFQTFDATPLAAGSIAQVHCATLFDGRRVIVKVRRPGIKRQVNEDVRILRWFVRSVLWLVPALRSIRPMELIDELARNLGKEIDFRQEAANIACFTEVFRNSTTVYIPGVVDELYTDWVIVQEMSPGLRIDDPRFAGAGQELAAHLVDAYLHQFIVVGVFHGDPHPGNLFVLEDGRICFHDFGLVGFLDRATRINLVAVMLAFVQQDGEWLLDASLDLGLLGGNVDRKQLRVGMEELMQDYARKPLKDWSFGEVFLHITRLGSEQNLRLPHHLLVLLRAIFLMESTVRKLDPAFNLIDGLFAKAGAIIEAGKAPAGAKAPDRLRYESLMSLKQLPDRLGQVLHLMRTEGLELSIKHRGLEGLQGEIRSSGHRISLGLVALGLYVGGSLLMQGSVGPRWGETPILALVGYSLAVWLTWRLLRGADAQRAK